ncbi:MAG: V-type ATPase subunit [Candidatus Hodarchaeota archaeon]
MAGSKNRGYIAARFYGMRSRLLKVDDYQRLLTSTDLSSLITNLRGVLTYKKALEEALLLEDPLTAINSAINNILSLRMKRILSFSGGSYYQGFNLMTLRWETSNIHLAIRAIIEETTFPLNFIPLGHLNRDELLHLTKLSSLDEALTFLESTLNPFATAVRSIIEQDIPLSDLNMIDGIFNYHYNKLISKKLETIKNKKIYAIIKKMINEEREFENTKIILNILGKLSRGKLPSTLNFEKVIIPGKARIKPEEINEAAKNKDINSLREILGRTSYREIFDNRVLDTATSRGLHQYVEEVERLFYKNQVRKRFKTHSFNLGLAYFWQMLIEARNLRILTHGIKNFTRDEIERRMFYV